MEHIHDIHAVRPAQRLGYVSSGRFAADAKLQEAHEHWRQFLWTRKRNFPVWQQRQHARNAIWAFRLAKHSREQVRDYE